MDFIHNLKGLGTANEREYTPIMRKMFDGPIGILRQAAPTRFAYPLEELAEMWG